MILLEESEELKIVNEMFVDVLPSLSPNITNSVYYNKLKYYMFSEIVNFCREKIELKQDLLELRAYIGEFLSEDAIRVKLDSLKEKYNNNKQNVGLEYHLESTRIDYGVVVFCIIKRDDIYCKKFIFRFRKNPQLGLSGLSAFGNPLPLDNNDKKEIRKQITEKLMGDDNGKI